MTPAHFLRSLLLLLFILFASAACAQTVEQVSSSKSSPMPSSTLVMLSPVPMQTREPAATRIPVWTITPLRSSPTTAPVSRSVAVPTEERLSIPPAVPPVIPIIDGTLGKRLRDIYKHGQKLGNRPGVFIKVGDSITESQSFLVDFGCKTESLGAYQNLLPTIDYFRKTTLSLESVGWCESSNSFSRSSLAATGGWRAEDALRPLEPTRAKCPAPYNTPLRCEIVLMRPSIALIMFGTNDVAHPEEDDSYRRNLVQIVSETVSDGVIPVLSTIPPRLPNASQASINAYNQIIREVAEAQQIPLWNYRLALQQPGMVNQGIEADGIHPSVYLGDHAADLTPEGLRYGYNMRNLTAIQVLDKIKRIVIDNGAPDSP